MDGASKHLNGTHFRVLGIERNLKDLCQIRAARSALVTRIGAAVIRAVGRDRVDQISDPAIGTMRVDQ